MQRVALAFLIALALDGGVAARQTSSGRAFTPDDLFRVRRVGAVAWSPDGRTVAVEFSKPSRWLTAVPTNEIAALDVTTRAMRIISDRSSDYVGFFGAVWAPDSRRLAFLSVDAEANVRAWIWSVGSTSPAMVPGIDVRVDSGDPSLAWVDSTRLAVLAWDEGAEKSGAFYIRLLRGRNAADGWKRAMDGRAPTVSVMSSGGKPLPESPHARLVVVDVESGEQKTLARGRLNRLVVARDGCCISFFRNDPAPVASYFELARRAGDVDAAYVAVTRGMTREAVDVRTAAKVDVPVAAPGAAARPTVPASPPVPNARRIGIAPAGDAALYAADGEDGSRLWISGGGRPLSSAAEIWRDNEWMREIRVGRSQSLSYATPDGQTLTAWLLLPPGYVAGRRVPLITRVYPGTVYESTTPAALSPYSPGDFEHAQLFAALGYAVLLPSIPTKPDDPSALEPLMAGVMPAIDAAVASGIADPDRLAVVGQSGGGFATLGLITQTNRFRSAIASAAYSNFVSLYGTFYGTYRYGDGGRPETAQVLRMLQLENGFIGLGADPWTAPARYSSNSPLLRADKVETPVMLIKGDLDFIPVQQAEEFFTALLRRDKRAVLLRYAGEEHGIIERQNVLDVWRRMTEWLAETMGP